MNDSFWERLIDEEKYAELQAYELASELAACLVYEAHQRIEMMGKENCHYNVFLAFYYLGRVKDILGRDFEKANRELYEKAKARFLEFGFSESDFMDRVKAGLDFGEKVAFPTEMGPNSIHYGFVAEMAISEIGRSKIHYVEGVGWKVWGAGSWTRRPREVGIVGLIYEVMRRKINIWRKALVEERRSSRGAGGWLENLDKNINDPDWLGKVEELLLRVDYFGVQVISSGDTP